MINFNAISTTAKAGLIMAGAGAFVGTGIALATAPKDRQHDGFTINELGRTMLLGGAFAVGGAALGAGIVKFTPHSLVPLTLVGGAAAGVATIGVGGTAYSAIHNLVN